jgi:PAS domain S-box-containing protein
MLPLFRSRPFCGKMRYPAKPGIVIEKSRILIVEDEAIIAMEVESYLNSLGYDVTSVVNTGEKAIEKAEVDKPDIVLMDIRIKGDMDGIDAAAVIRSRFGIPVIFSTAYLDEERIARAKVTMPFGYVLKPIQEQDLKITIEMALYVSTVDAARRLAEKKLQESEEKYRIAFEINSSSVTITRMDGVYIDINPGFTNLTGYTREDVIGSSSRDIHIWVKPEDRDALLSELKRSGRVENMETTFRCKGGSYINTLMSASIIELNNEPHIYLFSRNITDRVQAEAKLTASEMKFRKIFDNIQVPYLEVSLDGIILEISPSVERYLKYTREELIGKQILDLYVDPEAREVFLSTLLKYGELIDEEVRVRDKDGRILYAALYSKALPEQEIFIASLMDITARMKAESLE